MKPVPVIKSEPQEQDAEILPEAPPATSPGPERKLPNIKPLPIDLNREPSGSSVIDPDSVLHENGRGYQ